MLKKITLLVLIFIQILSMSINVQANDITFLKDNHLYCTVIPKTNEIQLGEDFEFTMKITNQSQYDCYIRRIYQIFNGDSGFDIEYENSDSIISISPYETIKIDCKYKVPFDIDWYKRGKNYYVNISAKIIYLNQAEDWFRNDLEKQEYCEKYGCGENEMYYFTACNANEETLKITNLNDGNHIIQMNTQYSQSITYIRDDLLNEPNNANLIPLTQSTSSIKNISEKECEIIACNNASINNTQNSILKPNEKYKIQHNGIAPYLSTLYSPVSAIEKNTAIIECEGIYYAIMSSKTLPINIISHKSFEFTKELDEESIYQGDVNANINIKVKNVSDIPLDNFYINYPATMSHIYNLNQYHEYQSSGVTIEKNEVKTIKCNRILTEAIKNLSIYDYNFGVQVGSYGYIFHVYKNIHTNKTECALINTMEIINLNPADDKISVVSSTEQVIPTATLSPTPKAEISSEAAEASTIPEVNNDTFIITNIENDDTIPIWTWIVLTITAIAALLLVFILGYQKAQNDKGGTH